jgi:hypothetical protein
MLYFNVLSELPLADEFGARMELEVKILILFLNEDKQIPFCKEKSLLHSYVITTKEKPDYT